MENRRKEEKISKEKKIYKEQKQFLRNVIQVLNLTYKCVSMDQETESLNVIQLDFGYSRFHKKIARLGVRHLEKVIIRIDNFKSKERNQLIPSIRCSKKASIVLSQSSEKVFSFAQISKPVLQTIFCKIGVFALTRYKISRGNFERIIIFGRNIQSIKLDECILDTEGVKFRSNLKYKIKTLDLYCSGNKSKSNWIDNPERAISIFRAISECSLNCSITTLIVSTRQLIRKHFEVMLKGIQLKGMDLIYVGKKAFSDTSLTF
ncbi:unnamed protein product [Moneuplotes crassus]|uniref:Uncharacterized protein n=1 Tax=Euplotes crassus TaxID=5936 RepID=A0AAD1XTZ7_EUPCR|nr:unnamed protein product [Moneuplotes crassus]